uniref:Reverse transcriptase RNase H-like domain-containing protein n=1 Tax=Chenopodium quinoa TaxID=63459 RepID=A0A803MZK3_CHEQI
MFEDLSLTWLENQKCFPLSLSLNKEKSLNRSQNTKKPSNKLKKKLATPAVLIPPKQNRKPLRLYHSTTKDVIASMLTRENKQGHKQAIFYLSRILHNTETRYTNAEKWCLSLYDASINLNHYFMAFLVEIISPIDVLKYMLNHPFIKGMLCIWSMHLSQFELTYVPQNPVKGQALVDFLANHPPMENVMIQEEKPWTMFFDESSRRESIRAE